MLYLQYEDYKNKYHDIQQAYDDILCEKEELFARTQPQSVNFERERISGGTATNKFEDYVIAKDKKLIDERLTAIKSILDDRERLLTQKEKELRQSANLFDKVYYMRFLDRMRIYKIANACHYSEAQIYRVLHEINESLKRDRK